MRRTFLPRMLISGADVEVYDFVKSKILPILDNVQGFCFESWQKDKENVALNLLLQRLTLDCAELMISNKSISKRVRISRSSYYWLEYFWSHRIRYHCSSIPHSEMIQLWIDELGELEEQLLPYLEEYYSVLPGHVGCFWSISYVHRGSD